MKDSSMYPTLLAPMATSTHSTRVSSSRSREDDSIGDSTIVKLARVTWKWILLVSLMSAAFAYDWANRHSTRAYEVESRLSFHRTSFGAPLYQGPDVHSLAAEFSSFATIEELRESLGLKVPASLISQRLKTSVMRGNGAIDIALTWEDADDGVMLLNRLIEIGSARAKMIRDVELDQHVKSLRHATMSLYEPRLDVLRDSYAEHSQSFGVADLNLSASELQREIDRLEEELHREQLRMQSAESRASLISRQIVDAIPSSGQNDSPMRAESASYQTTQDGKSFTNVVTATPVSTRIDASQPVTPTSMLQRMQDIKQEIDLQRNRAIAEAKLKHQENELSRLSRLVDKQLVPRSRYLSMKAEVDMMRLAVNGNEPVSNLQSELDELAEQVAAFGPNFLSNIDSLRDKERLQVEVENELRDSKLRVVRLENLITLESAKLENLESGLVAAQRILAQKDVAEQRVESHLSLAEGLENLKTTDANAFTMSMPPTPDPTRESSNWRKQFASAFMLLMLGLSTPITAVGLRRVMPTPGASLAKRLHLPELAEIPRIELAGSKASAPPNVSTMPKVRLLAVHLRQLIDPSNPTLHFVSLGSPESTLTLAHRVAESMSRLGEKVVLFVVDPEDPSLTSSQPSLAPVDDGGQACGIGRGQLAIIHVPPARVDEMPMIDDCEFQPDVVLIAGLDIHDRAAVELLSLKSGGVVLSAPGGDSITDVGLDVATSLVRYDASILGVVH